MATDTCVFLRGKWCKDPTAVRRVGVDWSEQLAPGETLAGSPTFAAAPAGPTFSSQINSTPESTALVSGGTAATNYVVTITSTTSGGQTLVAKANLEIH